MYKKYVLLSFCMSGVLKASSEGPGSTPGKLYVRPKKTQQSDPQQIRADLAARLRRLLQDKKDQRKRKS